MAESELIEMLGLNNNSGVHIDSGLISSDVPIEAELISQLIEENNKLVAQLYDEIEDKDRQLKEKDRQLEEIVDSYNDLSDKNESLEDEIKIHKEKSQEYDRILFEIDKVILPTASYGALNMRWAADGNDWQRMPEIIRVKWLHGLVRSKIPLSAASGGFGSRFYTYTTDVLTQPSVYNLDKKDEEIRKCPYQICRYLETQEEVDEAKKLLIEEAGLEYQLRLEMERMNGKEKLYSDYLHNKLYYNKNLTSDEKEKISKEYRDYEKQISGKKEERQKELERKLLLLKLEKI